MSEIIKNHQLGLDGIAVSPERVRLLRPELVDQIAQSFLDQGQLQSILVRPRSENGSGYILIAGRHRLEAARKLGWEAIRAEVRTGLDADRAMLVEIDENLMRGELSPAERVLHISKRAEFHAKIHGSPKAIGAQAANKKMGRKHDATEKFSVAFTTDTATKTGQTTRLVRMDVKRGSDLAASGVLPKVIGTSLDKGDQLDALAKLPVEQQKALASRAAAGEKVSAKTVAKKNVRDDKERELAERTVAASKVIGSQLYGVIYADPPWRFEPWSRDTGMDRAADNHYPTMPLDEIASLRIPAAADCVLFLWSTVAMLPQALDTLASWGFTYRSAMFWDKVQPGTGYWVRDRVEVLLIGAKGTVPAPAPGTQPEQLLSEKRGKHSVKPEAFTQAIEQLYPNVPKLEMFARQKRAGWDSWGNEAPEAPPPIRLVTRPGAAAVAAE